MRIGLDYEGARDEYLERMRAILPGDIEGAHVAADAMLVAIIRRFLPEFAPVCDAYNEVPKWYA